MLFYPSRLFFGGALFGPLRCGALFDPKMAPEWCPKVIQKYCKKGVQKVVKKWSNSEPKYEQKKYNRYVKKSL